MAAMNDPRVKQVYVKSNPKTQIASPSQRNPNLDDI